MWDWLLGDWPFWASGLAIGLVIVSFAAVTGRGLGVSRGFVNLCALGSRKEAFCDRTGQDAWRLSFLIGIPLGAFALTLLSGAWRFDPTVASLSDERSLPSGALQWVLFLGGGVLIGFGARRAGGCTSGHAITGMALGSRQSLIATIGFMGAAILVANGLDWVYGVLR